MKKLLHKNESRGSALRKRVGHDGGDAAARSPRLGHLGACGLESLWPGRRVPEAARYIFCATGRMNIRRFSERVAAQTRQSRRVMPGGRPGRADDQRQ